MIASIIIVTKNQKSFLEETIPTLLKQKLEEKFEIIVVDSGSTDGAIRYIKTLPVRLVKYKGSFNCARAFNLGASKARGKYLVRLSGDCVPQDNLWLKELLAGFLDEKVGGVFGKYIISGKKGYGYPDYWPKSRFPNKLKRYHIKPIFLMGILGIGGKRAFDFTGGCCAVRKSIWKKRALNEKLIEAEDAEYSWFIHLIGYDIVCNPKAQVLHEHKKNILKTIKNYSGLSKWNIIFAWSIVKYWIQRLAGKDIYKDFYFTSNV